MDGHTPPPVTPINSAPPSGAWKKKYECKRSKGMHDWHPHGMIYTSVSALKKDGRCVSTRDYRDLLKYERVGPIGVRSWVEWRCSHCGKMDREYQGNIKKKFDHSRHNLYADKKVQEERDRMTKFMNEHCDNISSTL